VGGVFISVVLGFAGGWFGTWLARELDLPFRRVSIRLEGAGEFPIVWSILGTLLVTCIVSWIQKSRKKEEEKR
jgi:uncharacterized membrane protein YeaQ/YmgE (transglycosylase-associated protein family)